MNVGSMQKRRIALSGADWQQNGLIAVIGKIIGPLRGRAALVRAADNTGVWPSLEDQQLPGNAKLPLKPLTQSSGRLTIPACHGAGECTCFRELQNFADLGHS